MKIKSLLLGSAAAMIAVTGARAADVVVVEPEPVEYVRVCDAYGAGFYYIPGTETCLRVSGYVRVWYASTEYHDGYIATKGATDANGLTYQVALNERQKHIWRYKIELNWDARNETEWGLLRSFIRLDGTGGSDNSAAESLSSDNTPAQASIGASQARIHLGGWRLGYMDDYWSTITRYGNVGGAISGGNYGFSSGLVFDYTFQGDGMSLTVGVSDNGRSGIPGQPDLYVGGDISGSWGYLAGTYHYDSSQEEGAWKGAIGLSLADFVPGGFFKAWYMGDNGNSSYVKGHVWAVSGTMDLTDKWSINSGYSDYDCEPATGSTTCSTSNEQWHVGLVWDVEPGLHVKFEYYKTNYDQQVNGVAGVAGTVTRNATAANAVTTTSGSAGTASRLSNGVFTVRVQRTF